ncbi:MAG: xanthine dehydrogenase family protein molybdopterin-binding subunit [Cyclobacteriaceae bacterium]
MSNSNAISRRKFLITTGGATIFISGCFYSSRTEQLSADSKLVEKQINIWVRILSDNTVVIYTPAAEMGQGSLTSVPMILADEMDADWSKVKILSSPVDAEKFGVGWYPGGTKNMTTAGSRTIRSYYQLMRETGAQIKGALLRNAANKWDVNFDELSTSSGSVIHSTSNRQMSYGEVAEFGNFEQLPDVAEVTLKSTRDFKIIGKEVARHDVAAKTNGQATYAIDMHLPGMFYGFINRSPVHGAKPTLTNRSEIAKMEGVQSIVELEHGIGVVAATFESGMKAKQKVQIQWSEAAAQAHTSANDLSNYSAKDAEIKLDEGDVDGAVQQAVRTIETTFTNTYVYHAQMEPLNAVVSLSPDKQSAEVWIGSQAPDGAQNAVAKTIGIEPEKVKVNQLFLGGGFGRRTLPGYAAECASLAMSVDAPVKLIWTREDDVRYGAFRPQVKHEMKVGIDQSGKIISWDHTAIGPGGGLSDGGAGIKHYDIANVRFRRKNVDHGIRTKHWRGVGHGPHKYAVESFIDQIARDQGKDPYRYRSEMMQGNDRARTVLDRAAQMSNWDPTPKNGRAMGISFADRDSLSCGVAQISLDEKTGIIRVHRYWCALDAGVVVHPDNAIAQVEGAVIMGMSSSLKEQIQFEKGRVVQSNFNDYPLLKMSEAPESIEVEFIPSEHKPEGIGEAGLPAVGGAIASAFAALTGKYLYDMPFTPENVLKVLNS